MIEIGLFKKTWRALNCTPKTMKLIRETQENLLCVGKRKELITKKGDKVLVQQDGAGIECQAHH